MDRIALWDSSKRAELFQETAARRNLLPVVIEKDFWVCWVLSKLFTSSSMQGNILFKGGTSLSKIFRLINRFSEDIDLILNWNEITDEDPEEERSSTKQGKFNKRLMESANQYIEETVLPEVKNLVGNLCEALIEKENPEVIIVRYPAAFPDKYIRPEVKLEIGPLASWVPNAEYSIQSYASEVFPDQFEVATCKVQAIKAERAFWEKATILHREAFRPVNKPQPPRYSRHYYDLASMAQTSLKDEAMHSFDLLKSVVEFKNKFYPQKWARYDLAKKGSLKLIPEDWLLDNLRKDYSAMKEMIFGDVLEFEKIIAILKRLEDETNNVVN